MAQPPTDRQEFERWLNMSMDDRNTARDDGRGFQVPAGPSILDLINNERLLAAGDYRRGLEHGLHTIDTANLEGRKPFYALKTAWAEACTKESSEFRRGVKTVQFIFNTPYKWIAGERP